MQQVGRAAVVRTADGRFCRFACSQTGQVLFTITYTPDYAEVDIALLETRRHPVFSLTDWEYMYTGAMFHNRLMQLGRGWPFRPIPAPANPPTPACGSRCSAMRWRSSMTINRPFGSMRGSRCCAAPPGAAKQR